MVMNGESAIYRDKWPWLLLLVLVVSLAVLQFSGEPSDKAAPSIARPLPLAPAPAGRDMDAMPAQALPEVMTAAPGDEDAMAPEPDAVATDIVALATLPAIDDSDAALRQALVEAQAGASVSGPGPLLVAKDLLRRFVVMAENISARRLPRRHLPVKPPGGRFKVRRRADGRLTIDPQNYRRYVVYVDAIEALDPRRLATVYRRFSPLFDQAFRDIGHRQGQPARRLLAAIDVLLATPVVSNPELKRFSVSYRYADARLEALPESQRLLIRIGADNAARIKRWLERFRLALVKETTQ